MGRKACETQVDVMAQGGAGLPPELSVLQSSGNGSLGIAEREGNFQEGRSLATGEKDIRLFKDTVQGISIASLHIMHDMAYLHYRLGHYTNRMVKEPTCASSSLAGKKKSEDAAGELS
eukprot:Gb_13976 [translate_table: standard]